MEGSRTALWATNTSPDDIQALRDYRACLDGAWAFLTARSLVVGLS